MSTRFTGKLASNSSPERTAKDRSPLNSIQACRGFAAFAVVIYHVGLFFEKKYNIVIYGGLTKLGYLGVPYFFVISGYIIGFAHAKDLGVSGKFPIFLKRRFLRVYPLYWIFSVIFIVASAFGFGDQDFSLAPHELIQSFALIHFTPEFQSPPLKVAWTLFYEVRFYLLFALAILYPRIATGISFVWVGLIFTIQPFNALTHEILSFWNLAFPFGLIVYWASKSLPNFVGKPALIVGCVTVSTILCISEYQELRGGRSMYMLLIMVGFSLIVLGLAIIERWEAFRVKKIFLFFGDASYVTYLVHSAAISLMGIIIVKTHFVRIISPELLSIPMVVGASLAGLAAHLLVERPWLAFSARWTRGGSKASEPDPKLS